MLVQGRVQDASLASDLREALVHFLGEMNYPEDLLTYSAEFLEAAPRREGPAEDSADAFDPHTDLGRFLRQVSLALRAMPFEVLPLDPYRRGVPMRKGAVLYQLFPTRYSASHVIHKGIMQ